MPTPTQLTRQELFDLVLQLLTDPYNKQNTAEVVREALYHIIESALIKSTDGLPVVAPGQASYDTIAGNPLSSIPLNALLEPLLRNWNDQKNPLKVVRTAADVANIRPLSCCLETVVHIVDNAQGQPKSMVLKYTDFRDGITLQVYRDGRFDENDKSDAAWYPVDSPEAGVPAYSQLTPAYSAGPPLSGYAFAVDELVRAFVPGSTTEQFFAALTPAGPRPAPSNAGGDSFWRVVNRGDVPTPPPAITYRPITVAAAQALALTDNGVQPITYRILRGADVDGRRGDVQVQGLAYSPALTPDEGDFPAQFASIVLWQDPLDGIWKSRRYDVATDTVYPLDVTPPPFVLEDLGGNFTSYDTADSAFAASAEDYVLDVNRNESPLAASAVLFGVVNGRNRNLTGNTGVTLTFGASLQLNDLNFVSGGLALETSGNNTVVNYSHGRFTRPLRIRATDILIATYVDLSGVVTVEGTLTLRTGSTVPSGFFASFTRHADGTYTTPAGGTVLDERAGYVTATDIEITDPTKGIIMTVGSTRVRARIAGTAGARTWTFTEL